MIQFCKSADGILGKDPNPELEYWGRLRYKVNDAGLRGQKVVKTPVEDRQAVKTMKVKAGVERHGQKIDNQNISEHNWKKQSNTRRDWQTDMEEKETRP